MRIVAPVERRTRRCPRTIFAAESAANHSPDNPHILARHILARFFPGKNIVGKNI
jgi:hypothetical protein